MEGPGHEQVLSDAELQFFEFMELRTVGVVLSVERALLRRPQCGAQPTRAFRCAWRSFRGRGSLDTWKKRDKWG